MFEEVDYLQEGQNAERFGRLYGLHTPNKCRHAFNQAEPRTHTQVETERTKAYPDPSRDPGDGVVKVPKIYWEFTTKGILTMEWIDGIKLTDRDALLAAKLDIQQLVDQGVLSSLRQLLEEGYFHADPHPGNVVVTRDGVLAYFDFGMMSEFRREYRTGLIRTVRIIPDFCAKHSLMHADNPL
jgi:aarF domain-containing kinase